MRLKSKQEGEIIFVYPQGKLDIDVSSRFEQEINDILDNNPNLNICVNCEFVEYINSTSLRVLITTSRKLMESDKKLYICCINRAVEKLLEIIPLENIIEVKEDENEVIIAVKALTVI